MAFFGTDGDTSAGVSGANPSSPSVLGVTQDTMVLCGGTAGEAGTPTDIAFWVDASDGSASNCYMGIYKGGSATDPTGATLIGTSGNFTTPFTTTKRWVTAALSSTAAFAASDKLWIAFLARGSFAHFYNRAHTVADVTGNYRGDWLLKTNTGTYDYVYQCSSVTGTGLPSTVPAGAAYSATPMVAYITYTAGGASGVVPQARNYYAQQ